MTDVGITKATLYYTDSSPAEVNHLLSDCFSENVSTYSSSSELRKIYSKCISFNNGHSRLDITIPERALTLTTSTLIIKNFTFPESVYVNNILRTVIWINRNSSFNFGTSGSSESCGNNYDGSSSNSNCWDIITFRVFQGNIQENNNDIKVFAYLEGTSSVDVTYAG